MELHPLTVFFGSQTGTAEGYATRIVDDAKKHGFEAEAVRTREDERRRERDEKTRERERREREREREREKTG